MKGSLPLYLAPALVLGACGLSPGRPGPFVEGALPAPFLTERIDAPSQAEAQAAVDDAVRRWDIAAVFPRFSALSESRRPTYVTLFACGPGLLRPAANSIDPRVRAVACHVDVMDENFRLLGRTTMSFYRDREGWRLVSGRERERDAR